MAYFVYAIKSLIDNRIYVGMTDNIERRLYEHNNGKTKSTKGYKPWTLIFKEKAETRKEARRIEKYYKRGCGREFLKSYRPYSSMDRTEVS
ncbi:MAG: GIY-YIG nuclease family protein [Bacteroidales bacterium]